MSPTETLKTLKDIETAIRREQSTEELLVLLATLLDITETELSVSPIESGRMNQMAEYLAEIRYLLERIGGDPARKSVSFAAKVMAMRYRDLEGKVKEVRNDCSAGRCRT